MEKLSAALSKLGNDSGVSTAPYSAMVMCVSHISYYKYPFTLSLLIHALSF